MKRSDRMTRINAVNKGIKSLAGADLARAEAAHSSQVHQLEQLHLYKAEYAAQLNQRLATQVSAATMQDYRFFFASLHRAISQQESVVRQLRSQVDAARAQWLAKDQEVRKLNTLSDRLRQSEAVAATRLDHKEMDALPLRARPDGAPCVSDAAEIFRQS